ncbi:MAG: stage II sporulation protein M [Thermoanaerobaculia bacterium]
MRYERFVELRRPVWERFEAGLEHFRTVGRRAGGRRGALDYGELERLAADYRAVLHDHAIAAARFAGTAVAERLARLAVDGTHLLTVSPAPRDRAGLVGRALTRFADSFRRQRREILLAAGVFLVTAFVGLGLVTLQPGLISVLVGPQAVAELEEGTLWTESLTRTTPASVTSSHIATNNLSVALTAWAGGALAGIWTFWALLFNGFHLGGIVAVTLHYGVAGKLFDFVAAHGPLELTLIVVCAGAGLTLARALVAATDRPRAVELRQAGKESLILVVGCLPWFVLLALVEGLVSPEPAVPVGIKALVGFGLWSAFLVVALGPRPQKES